MSDNGPKMMTFTQAELTEIFRCWCINRGMRGDNLYMQLGVVVDFLGDLYAMPSFKTEEPQP